MIDLEQIADTWCDWALATTWQLALLVGLVWLAALVAKPVSARLRYALWGLVIIKVFLPPSLSATWGVGQWGIGPVRDLVRSQQTDVTFSVNEEADTTVIKVTKTETGELIKQFPPEEILAMIVRLRKNIGWLVDKKA